MTMLLCRTLFDLLLDLLSKKELTQYYIYWFRRDTTLHLNVKSSHTFIKGWDRPIPNETTPEYSRSRFSTTEHDAIFSFSINWDRISSTLSPLNMNQFGFSYLCTCITRHVQMLQRNERMIPANTENPRLGI